MRPEVGKPGASWAFSFFYIEPRFMRYNVGSLFKGLFNGLVVILGMVFLLVLSVAALWGLVALAHWMWDHS
jgi:hypothetical protein